jgi:GntR family transcriptional regulator/MocR family aminotransferase
MVETWAISGVDLHVDLSGTRVREALERSLRDAVQTGRLTPGTLLPPSRALAGDLGIARNTVAEAYGQLVGEGWLTARQGSGTRVATQPALPAPAGPVTAVPAPAIRYDLRAGYPDLTSFPRGEWLAACRSALNTMPADALGYDQPHGRAELRTALATYLARARGVRANADAIVVCAGFTHALWLLGRALRHRGARAIGVEAYGHQRHRDVLTDTGLRVVALPVDADGATPAGLDNLDAVLLTPAHQFPTGAVLSARRRIEFAAWAAKSGGVVIEDDYDGEFRYDRRALGAMQALAPNDVVYAGTASKTLAPGLRLAWLVVPTRLMSAVVGSQAAVDSRTAVLDQLTLAEFIDSGRYDRHIRRSRLAYRHRRDRLVATLARRVPGGTVRGLPAGLQVLLDLPAGRHETDVVAHAAARELAVEGLATYAADGTEHTPALVIGYGTPPPHAYTTALARLSATLTEAP